MAQRYRTIIAQTGNNTGIPVPDDVVESLGGGKRARVLVTVSGYSYRNSIGAMNGRSIISLSAAHRAASGLSGGQEVDVVLELDEAPRELHVPEDLAAALAAHPPADEAFAALPFSVRQRHLLAVQGAKTPETRARRVAKVLADVQTAD